LGDQCYQTIVIDQDYFHEECFSIVLSKLIGVCIILGAMVIKVPQILNIITQKSAAGLAITSTYLELFAISGIISYNVQKGYEFETYGEVVFDFTQNIILVYLIMYYQSKPNALPAIFYPVAGGFIALVVLLGFVLPGIIIDYVFLYTNTPILILSRFPQIYENYKNGDTGALSATTFFMQCAGSLARVFTTLQQTGDLIALVGYSTAAFLNGVIFFQIIFSKKKQE